MKLDFIVDSNERYLLLDHFPLGRVKELQDVFLSRGIKLYWSLPNVSEVAIAPDPAATEAKDRAAILIDAYSAPNPDELLRELKGRLLRQPQLQFFVLGDGNLKSLRFSDNYGSGRYVDCEQVGLCTRSPLDVKDDSDLLKHSRRMTPKYQMGDIVLGPLTRLKLEESISFIQTRKQCEEDWGFRKKHNRGHGVTLLFHGESGTGKTMAAEVVASTLGLPLYQIDLSSVVSKWVGETEKNLKSIFRAAEGVQGILLFDEGDAIFGSRTDTQSSQDRYSNLEVNYLLQEIEAFQGIAILSTNYFRNLDSAFLRRFSYCIHFSAPSQEQRVQIWSVACPNELPLGTSVDFNHLSQFGLNGGNIRNCVRYAAAQAAVRRSTAVEQEDFLWAIKRELQKHDLNLPRELVGEELWRRVAPEWETQMLRDRERIARKSDPNPSH